MKRSLILHQMLRTTLFIGVILFVLLVWTKSMAKWGHGSPPALFPTDQQANLIVVHKGERQLVLMRDGIAIGIYSVSLGSGVGAKQREGDKKTPEGYYFIDSKNSHSRFHLSLHISYPDINDLQRSQAAHYPSGENIMIHGLPNGWGWFGLLFQLFDWTDGCIAVSNADMKDIWAQVATGTPVIIEP